MFLFFGYPFFRILLPIWAFFAGLMFGVHGIESVLGAGFISVSLGLMLGLGIGIVLAALAYFVYAFAVYIFGISAGYVLGSGLMLALGFNNGLISTVAGVVGAVLLTLLFLSVRMPRFIIVFLTAAAGAMAVIMGIFVLFGRVPDVVTSLELTQYIVANSWFWFIVWALLASLGLAFQYVVVTVVDELNDDDLYGTYDWGLKKSKKRK